MPSLAVSWSSDIHPKCPWYGGIVSRKSSAPHLWAVKWFWISAITRKPLAASLRNIVQPPLFTKVPSAVVAIWKRFP